MTSELDRVRAVRERLFAEGAVVAGGARRDLFPVAIGREEGLALRDRVAVEGAARTLEVGLGFAISTLFLCEGLLANGPGGRHVAIDPHQLESYADAGLRILEQAGVLDLVELHAAESQIVLPRLLDEGRRFDLAFVDGNHRFEAVFLDLIYAARLLEERAIVFVDDTQLPGVRRALSFCLANLGWTVEDEGAEGDAHAWTVARTGPYEAFARPYESFVEF